jgi:hypothetical protein
MKPEQRLEQIFRENDNKGMAIAITGSWGVGKTFFWNEFKENYQLKKKYVYVSLFGLESLSDLKTHIYSHIENNSSAIEIPRWIRGLPSILKDTKISQFGISSSAKIFDSLMFNQVKDAIICFDDFERMSNKLDIKDVMGLANQLKLERNCQVVLILDESKTESENKKKYAAYKEKLIDEEVKINSVEPLIRANTKDIDTPLVDLMVKFSNELEIHNFRFFQKVIKLYGQFIQQLPKEVAYSTKEIILIRILQGYLIEDYGEIFNIQWSGLSFAKTLQRKAEASKDDVSLINPILQKLGTISHKLTLAEDEWAIQFKKWFEQNDIINFDKLKNLANSDLISEENNILKEEFFKLSFEFWNYQCNETFIQRFFEASMKNIGLQNLGNLNFAISVLEKLNATEYVTQLEEKVKLWIQNKLQQDTKSFRGINAFGQGDHRFSNYIDNYLIQNPKIGLPSVVDSIYARFINQQWSDEHELVISKLSKEEMKHFIEVGFFADDRFRHMTIASIVKNFHGDLKHIVKEVLDERRTQSEFHDRYIDFLISDFEK